MSKKELDTDYFAQCDRTLLVDLWYPRSEDRPNEVIVGLVDVRAADDIRITYDFDRDGWRIEQAQRFSWPNDNDMDPAWKEVAFVQAWGSKDAAWAFAVTGRRDDE